MLRIRPECLACSLSSAIRAIKHATEDPEVQRIAAKKVAEEFGKVTWNETPLDLSYIIQRVVVEITGVKDPYLEAKKLGNQAALSRYQEAKKLVMESDDPLRAAIKFSIAGNLIDYGPYSKVDLEAPFQSISHNLAIDDYDVFRRRVMNSDNLLYFVDNSGEIVFDKLLIDVMNEVKGKTFSKVSLVVKESPLINDATMDDVREVRLLDLPNVDIKLVGDGKGSAPSFKSGEVRAWPRDYDLTIMKGQGNFETFEDLEDVFFLLVAKCPMVSSILGVKERDFILKYSGG